MSPGFGLVQAPAYVWPAALSSAIRGTGGEMQGMLCVCMCVIVYVSVCVIVNVFMCVFGVLLLCAYL